MSRYRRLKIEGGAFFFTFTLADRRSELLGRILINSYQCPFRSESDRLAAMPRSDA
jgi:REP element-mobilizing transposase RayT